MKRFLVITTVLLVGVLGSSQSQVPAAAQVPDARKQLQAIKEANAKLLEQQAKTLQMLEEMAKTAQQMKMLGGKS